MESKAPLVRVVVVLVRRGSGEGRRVVGFVQVRVEDLLILIVGGPALLEQVPPETVADVAPGSNQLR